MRALIRGKIEDFVPFFNALIYHLILRKKKLN